ncbi:hypothetical protein TIFTF001_050398 [Ficus carica]|uniref:Uncharacterized protein n=1 Tax=Ficus carica TaxID=3494 RepID=A0AA87Z7L0_FICCA|nr:hypothetical protein TIFTF001_050398 [Ficus carica]
MEGIKQNTQAVLPDEEMDKLFHDTMKSQWKEVVGMYRKRPSAHDARITISEDTALHIAISDGKTDIALELINIVDESKLQIKNLRGDTPLHVAAALGNFDVCELIAAKNKSCAFSRNKGGETPIFLTALHGKYEPFLLFHSLDQDEKHLRRNNGDTILHVAISNEYFRKGSHFNYLL